MKNSGIKIKILVLENQYSVEVNKLLEKVSDEVKVVKTLEDLEKISPEDFYPNFVILNYHLPPKTEEKQKSIENSLKIAKQKWPKAIIFVSFAESPMELFRFIYYATVGITILFSNDPYLNQN